LRLTELTRHSKGKADPEISGLTQDSRAVKPGYLFAALPGTKTDGGKFIEDAVRNGAVAVMAPAGTQLPANAILIPSDNPRRDVGGIAAKFYGAQPRFIAAVTGTNGKTSTVHFTRQLWQSLGFKSASLGTLGLQGQGVTKSGSMTTPDPITLHATLAEIADKGVTHLAMEASSHGLDQFRLDAVKVTAAGFTNITRDHLDYHSGMDAYLAAKMRLFSDVLQPDGVAVLNADVPEFDALDSASGKRVVIDYGYEGHFIRLVSCEPRMDGQQVKIEILGRKHEFHLPLVGAFMTMNVLCALGLVIAGMRDAAEIEEEGDHLIKALSKLEGAPGRLQFIPGHPEGAVYIDYAHTPDALENILKALRRHTEGRLICVMGCGGDRDPGKRPIMGKISVELADMTIVTDDNPRTEDAAKIRAQVLGGAKGATEIGDRREAIRKAVREIKKGDVLVIAGKGHEQGQIIGARVEPFDDAQEAFEAIKILKGEAGA
jgi:UDP-N-acetylmuramoyl-L-alanyl-D-glutamate--2,6-diaminopimelate ligase